MQLLALKGFDSWVKKVWTILDSISFPKPEEGGNSMEWLGVLVSFFCLNQWRSSLWSD